MANWVERKKALLMLEDGSTYEGLGLGKEGTVGGEICFNTGMTGYQEIYTDPSYYGQIIVNTTPHIGNYGVRKEMEAESANVTIRGMVCNSFSQGYSRHQADASLQEYLESAGVVGISEVDTRQIVRHVRKAGVMNAVISTEILDEKRLKEEVKRVPTMKGLELSSVVSVTKAYTIGLENDSRWRIAVMDYGIKKSILENLTDRGAFCKIFPAKTSIEKILEWEPNGFFLSNGPGDPGAMPYAVETVKEILKTKKPTFGICLGHQLIAEASGIPTFKMHHGHRGLNHPVKNQITGKCEVTSQNHGFAVDAEEVVRNPHVELTHVNLNDGTIEGIRRTDVPAFSVQYHPEASPGPHDSLYLFDQFAQMLDKKEG